MQRRTGVNRHRVAKVVDDRTDKAVKDNWGDAAQCAHHADGGGNRHARGQTAHHDGRHAEPGGAHEINHRHDGDGGPGIADGRQQEHQRRKTGYRPDDG